MWHPGLYLLSKYLLRACYVLGTVLDAGDSTVTKTDILGGKTDNKQTNEETNHKYYRL